VGGRQAGCGWRETTRFLKALSRSRRYSTAFKELELDSKDSDDARERKKAEGGFVKKKGIKSAE